jgi:membrane protease YdiL (CAAX protease family)
MLGSGPLDILPFWAVFVVTVLLILFAGDSGYRFGRYRRAHVEDEKEAPVGAMVSAALALLAFMLAITFSIAATRFDDRRSLVLQEANSAGTTYLRAGMLPERGPELRALLREYVDIRIAVAQGQLEFGEARRRSEDLQTRMWAHATAVATAHPNSIVAGLFVQTLNELIDLHSMRLAALRARIPLPIWFVMGSMALIGFAAMGYSTGLSRTRRSPAAIAVALCFALVMVLIVDLDRPYEGLLRTSQQALIDARQGMQ